MAANEELNETGRHRLGTFPNDWRKRTKHKSCCQCIPSLILNHRHPFLSAKFATKTSTTKTITTSSPSSSRKPKRRTRLKQQLPPLNTSNETRCNEKDTTSPAALARRLRLRRGEGEEGEAEETEERAEVCKSRPSRLIRCNCLTYLVIFFYLCLFASPSQLDDRLNGFALLTSANELFSSSEPATQPEAQPLVYMLHAELGSGDGLGGGGASYSRAGSSSSMPNSELGGGGGSPTTGAADVAPALIEARCWNNYENDNDCKQLNVITAPEGERQQIQHQQQQHYNQQQTSNEDDTIITPVVIFEASSNIEPAQDTNSNGDGVGQRGDNELLGGQERPVFMAPPYQSNDATGRRGESRKYNKQQQYDETGTTPQSESSFVASAPTPRTWNVNMNSGGEGVAAPPVTRPSTIHFVVTPRPKSGNRKPVTGKTTKTTTQGRRCRDENDADCDEPEDNQIQPAKSYNSLVPPDQADKDDMDEGGDDDDQDEENNNNNNNDIGSPSSTRPNQVEPGSGGGLGQGDDDNDDSTDDGDDEDSTGGGDSSESSGSNSIQESTSLGPDETTGKDGRLLVITTRYPGNDPHWDRPSYLPPVPKLTTSTTTTTITSSAAATEATSTVVGPSTARRPQPGAAEIEVVVHSTLPPSFPGSGGRTTSSTNSLDEFGVDPTTATTTTTTSTTTTMMPDETYTSRPIFPSSTLASASVSASPSGGGGSGDDQNPNQNPNELPGSSSPNEALQTTTEVDLYTFKPIPIPVEPAEARPRFEPQNSLSTTDSSAQPGDPKQPKPIGSQHIYDPDGVHRRPPSGVGVGNTYDRPPYDDGWTTRKPVVAQHLPGQTQDQIDQIDAWIGSKRLSPSKTYNYMGTDILSTMLLYASIIILVFISLIFVTIAYSFWRRNSLRSRALLAKAQMMNGRPPHGMIESMSHVSHLMHGADGLPPSQPQPPPGTQQGLLSTYAQAKGSSMGKVTTSLVKPMDHQSGGSLGASVDPDEDLEEEEDDMDEQRGEQQTTRHHHHMNQQERSFKDDDSKEQLAADDEGSYLEDHHQNLSHSQQHPQGQHQQQTRAPRLAGGGINDSMRNQSGSWSTEDPTTTSSGSQRTQDSQLQQQQQQQHASSSMQQHNGGQRSHHPYPNSLSDGRQNSSSISDSQCSPDPGPSGNQSMTPLVMQTSQQQQQQPMMMPPNQPSHHMPLNSNIHNHNQQPSPQHLGQVAYAQQQPRQALQPMGARPMFRSTNGAAHMGPMVGPPAPGAPMSPIPRQPFHHPMMMMNGSAGPGGMKHRLVASRSIEDIQPSQHVGFIESNNNSHVPYAPVHQQQQSPHLHLLGGQPGIQARPQYQYPAGAHVAMGAGNSALLQRNNINNNNSMISPQRIAMSPLATLGRRGYPPGAGLNRNIYSEDSSSFMTTSPSLARTSSSSSFAFNMSNLPTPSSIKAKPIVDGSGRIFNDYTAGFNDTNNSGSQCNSNGTSNGNSNGNSTGSAGPPAAGVPPVFGRNDRSEAWYV